MIYPPAGRLRSRRREVGKRTWPVGPPGVDAETWGVKRGNASWRMPCRSIPAGSAGRRFSIFFCGCKQPNLSTFVLSRCKDSARRVECKGKTQFLLSFPSRRLSWAKPKIVQTSGKKKESAQEMYEPAGGVWRFCGAVHHRGCWTPLGPTYICVIIPRARFAYPRL